VHASAGSWRCTRSTASIKRVAAWEYSECIVCVVCLFIRNDPETTETQGHSNTTQLQHPPSLPRSRKAHTHNERADVAHAIHQKSRQGANEEIRKSPPNGDAQRPLDHCQRWRFRRARSERQRASTNQRLGAGQHQPTEIGPRAQHAVYSTQQQLRLFKMDTVHGTVLTAIPAQAN
jgi:hypothetical protein